MYKLATDLFNDWLTEQLPFNKEKWTTLLNTWLKPKTTKELWNNIDQRAKKLIRQSIRNEFIDYPLNGSEESPRKTAMKYFRSWLRLLDWQINFLTGNRPWCTALENLTGVFSGCCIVKKRTKKEAASGIFYLDKKGVIILKNNGKVTEEYSNVLDAVLVGGWSPD